MKKRASDRKKIRVEIWVALIGLAGVVITAIFGSPVLIKLLERTPIPYAANDPASMPASASTSLPVSSTGCEPAGIIELPQQAVAVVESIEGVTARIPLNSLRFEYQTSLRLASGFQVEFVKMHRIDMTNPDFTGNFTVEVAITLLNCSVHNDVINSGSDSNLTGDSALGDFQLHILKVKSIVFEW
jgi:hypothetical protein